MTTAGAVGWAVGGAVEGASVISVIWIHIDHRKTKQRNKGQSIVRHEQKMIMMIQQRN